LVRESRTTRTLSVGVITNVTRSMTEKDSVHIPPDLAPESRAIMERAMELGLVPDEITTVEAARAKEVGERALMAEPPPLEAVEDVVIDGPGGPVPLRIYRPAGEPPLPTLVHMHGGGWVLGNLDHADVDCRCLAADTGSLVVSVGYRLAPEHKFPAGLDDVFAAAEWTAAEIDGRGGDPEHLAVSGSSAGGNLAAALCMLAARSGGPRIEHQVLIYPVTDHSFDTASYRDFAEGYWLELADMRWFWGHYLETPDQGADPLASILRAPDLSGLPPATILTAGCDVLRDEAEAYGERLREAGVPVAVLPYPGQLHGFWSCGAVTSLPRRANAAIAAALGRD
jgi:acetyl esterase